MGNAPGKPHSRPRNKKYLQIKGTDRPAPPGKPYLAPEVDSTPDVLTIRWDTPHKNGGAPLSGYLVEHRRTGSPHWVRATPLMVRVPELTLSGLEPGWRYQFRVFAENLVGLSDSSELSDPLTVTLQRSAVTSPRFTQELKDTVVLENEKVEFVAYFVGQPAPKMCWFKDGFEIFSSRRTRILTEGDRSILTIHQSAICDEGEIKCTATNKAGHISTKARLTLEAPPSIRLPRQYEDGLLFEIGELIRFKVSTAGLPAPLIFWTHNGESINENERYEIENDDKTSTLRISEALRGDRGEYQIKAVNKLGSDIASFLVTVTDKPSPPGRAKVVMSLGRSVTLSWNTPDDDGGCKIGNYIVEYYRLGWNVWLKAATSRQLTTILGDLIEGSEYKFRIKAESPFGVSEPSEESDLIFIPDPKRGILEPTGSRSRSQPKDIIDPKAPVAAKRRKPRSHSSSRGEELEEESNPGSPIRPERLKIKSPPKTPERLSPHVQRKEVNVTAINKALFDRSTMSREFSYGSPEIKIKRTDIPIPKEIAEVKPTPKPPNPQLQESIRNTIQVVERQKQKSPSPIKGRSPSPSRFQLTKDTIDVNTMKESSPGKKQNRSPGPSRDDSENLGGSTEFMMVLYPGENKEMFSTEFVFDLDNEDAIPPPLSLSAPELGSEPPVFEPLRLSASSTELLHERAMVRFYQEALAEEEAIKRRRDKVDDERRASLIPKIQINSKEDSDIVGIERKHSLRRRLSAGGSVPQQVLLAQKRQSWRNSNEFSDLFDSKVQKTTLTVEEKRELMQSRQRSHSEEKEEEIFERVRKRMADLNPETAHKKKISVVEEEAWEPEYEESISEEESSEDDRIQDEPVIREITPEEEDQTYHPRMVFPATETKSKYEEPFEILTKPAKLPDANFIPKPILKKKDNGNTKQPEISEAESQLKAELEEVYHQPLSKFVTKRGSIPDIPLEEELDNAKQDTGAVASIAGMTAAVVAIPQQLLDKKEAEESKVVIEHYGDIVKTRGHKLPSQLENNPIREALRKAAALQAALHHSDEEEEGIINNNRSSDFNERFKTMERKLEAAPQAPRSLTPIFKQVKVAPVSDDIFEKLKQVSPPKIENTAQHSRTKQPIKESTSKSIETTEPQQAEVVRGRETSRYVKRNVAQSKSPHKEARKIRKSSPSPVVKTESRSNSATKKKTPQSSRSNSSNRNQSRSNSITRPPSRSTSKQRQRRSPSPQPMLLRKPKMCEIMTQTSASMDTYEPSTSTQVSSFDERLKTNAQLKVRSTMDYTTDLAMFAVALWVFMFSNELFALPVLLVAVYRQLKDEMKRWVPKWIKKRWNRPKKE